MTESHLYDMLLEYRRLLSRWNDAAHEDTLCIDDLHCIHGELQQLKIDMQDAAGEA
jgi:hypothetical protein